MERGTQGSTGDRLENCEKQTAQTPGALHTTRVKRRASFPPAESSSANSRERKRSSMETFAVSSMQPVASESGKDARVQVVNVRPVQFVQAYPVQVVQAYPVQVVQAAHVQVLQVAPVQVGPVQAASLQAAPVQAGPVQAASLQAAPVQAGPVQAASLQAAPVQAGPVQAGPVQAGPVQAGPVQAGPVQAALQGGTDASRKCIATPVVLAGSKRGGKELCSVEGDTESDEEDNSGPPATHGPAQQCAQGICPHMQRTVKDSVYEVICATFRNVGQEFSNKEVRATLTHASREGDVQSSLTAAEAWSALQIVMPKVSLGSCSLLACLFRLLRDVDRKRVVRPRSAALNCASIGPWTTLPWKYRVPSERGSSFGACSSVPSTPLQYVNASPGSGIRLR